MVKGVGVASMQKNVSLRFKRNTHSNMQMKKPYTDLCFASTFEYDLTVGINHLYFACIGQTILGCRKRTSK